LGVQALEPAVLIPLMLLARGGKVVLVGDPKQLPATVLSQSAALGGLEQSLFERLQVPQLSRLSALKP
jgi:senataxin